jgi:hypothetical protein
LFLSPSGRGWIGRKAETGEGLAATNLSHPNEIFAGVGDKVENGRLQSDDVLNRL